MDYWCKSNPSLPRVFSPSSLKSLSTCAKQFEYSYIQGWTPKGENVHMSFGSLVHLCIGTYVEQLYAGRNWREAADAALEVAWDNMDDLPPDVKGVKTKLNLLRAIVGYTEKYQDEAGYNFIPFDGKVAVEVYFATPMSIINPDGEPYILQGFLDGFRHLKGVDGDYVWEIKTTQRALTDFYFGDFNPNIQVGLYSYIGNLLLNRKFDGLVIDAIRVNANGICEFERRSVELTEQQSAEYYQDALHLVGLLERYVEMDFFPRNTSACGRCDFKAICSARPQVRELLLNSDFKQERRKEV